MVKGIDFFKKYFRDFTDQYVLIGGAAYESTYEDIPLAGISYDSRDPAKRITESRAFLIFFKWRQDDLRELPVLEFTECIGHSLFIQDF